jgi:4a-hydroxytetrahydrobiopterin dehydratase
MTPTNAQLREQHCTPKVDALASDEVSALLAAVPGWQADGARIVKSFDFKDYYRTLAFVNAIAAVIHAEDHHPELVVTYNRCSVKFDTHSVNAGKGGLSMNDFICAAKVDAIFSQSFS